MKIAAVLWIVMHCVSALAGELDFVLMAPADSPRAGEMTLFTVYLHNRDENTAQGVFPEQILCRLTCMKDVKKVTAFVLEPAAGKWPTVPGNGFLKAQYRMMLPPDMSGVIILQVPVFDESEVMFAVESEETATWRPDEDRIEDAESEKYTSLDSLFALYQPYLGNLSTYHPMYFLVGAHPKNSKFQLSFRYRFFNPEGTLTQAHPWVNGFHLAYTQTSFWNLASDSMPFEDTSYKPELFFLSSNIPTIGTEISRLFLQSGFQHESNGRGGDDSRSTNFLYIQPIWILFKENSRLGLQISPKLWTYVQNDDDTNPDLEDYRGYFDLGTKIGKADGIVLESRFRWARKGGSVQLNLTHPLRWSLFDNLDFYLQVQYVNGLAESLLEYTKRTETFRFGIAIIR